MHKNRHSQQQFKIIRLQYRIQSKDGLSTTIVKLPSKCELLIKLILSLCKSNKKCQRFDGVSKPWP